MRGRNFWAYAVVSVTLWGCADGNASERLRVLVTNDDGVQAEGIAALVDELARNAQLDLFVIAPDGNRSGSSDQFSTQAFEVRATSTASGFPATSESGFPADASLFGILQELSPPPDLVVSGINAGQNIGELIGISGTVGAGLWAARMDVPAIAVSQGLVPVDYTEAAEYAAQVVEIFRTDAAFRNSMESGNAPDRALVLNINFPTCTAGTTRGVRVVPAGRSATPIGYELTSDIDGVQTYLPIIERTNILASDCTSTVTGVGTDVEAMNNGFASVTPLNTDLTATANLAPFLFLER